VLVAGLYLDRGLSWRDSQDAAAAARATRRSDRDTCLSQKRRGAERAAKRARRVDFPQNV